MTWDTLSKDEKEMWRGDPVTQMARAALRQSIALADDAVIAAAGATNLEAVRQAYGYRQGLRDALYRLEST